MSAWADAGSIVGSVAVTVALGYSARQTKTLQDELALARAESRDAHVANRAGNDLRLMTQTMTLDRLFVDAPELRPYFYDGQPIPMDEPERSRVLATAELIIDLADTVASMIRLDQLDSEDARAWAIALPRSDGIGPRCVEQSNAREVPLRPAIKAGRVPSADPLAMQKIVGSSPIIRFV